MQPPPISSKRRLKRIAPLQAGKMLAVLYGAMGLLFVPFFLLMGVFTQNIPAEQRAGMMFMTGGFALFAPVFYAVIGFVFGLVGAAIYNVVARWIGGIEVEVE